MIRKFKTSDTTDLIKLWQSAFPNEAPHNNPSKIIKDKLAVDDLIFVAEKNQILLGACVAGYDGHRGWLYAIAVHKSVRRNGTGSKLIQHALNHLKSINCTKVNLQIRSDNIELVPFYEALGFETEDRISMGSLIQ